MCKIQLTAGANRVHLLGSTSALAISEERAARLACRSVGLAREESWCPRARRGRALGPVTVKNTCCIHDTPARAACYSLYIFPSFFLINIRRGQQADHLAPSPAQELRKRRLAGGRFDPVSRDATKTTTTTMMLVRLINNSRWNPRTCAASFWRRAKNAYNWQHAYDACTVGSRRHILKMV